LEGVDTMADRFGTENRRHIEQSERFRAEALLDNMYPVRIYSWLGNVARGTVTLDTKEGLSVHTAYVVCENSNCAISMEAVAKGILFDRDNGSLSVVLCERSLADEEWQQYRIAEAVDFWEGEKSPKIYCLNEKSCGAVVYTGDGAQRKYLIIRMNLGHCGLPKGHVEKFETERDTAVREVREETGVEITLDPDFRKSVSYYLTQRTTKESVYFLGRFDGDDVIIQESEVSSYKLCSYEEARRLITYENDRAILDAAEELLNSK